MPIINVKDHPVLISIGQGDVCAGTSFEDLIPITQDEFIDDPGYWMTPLRDLPPARLHGSLNLHEIVPGKSPRDTTDLDYMDYCGQDPEVVLEFSNIEALDTAIGWLQELRERFLKRLEAQNESL